MTTIHLLHEVAAGSFIEVDDQHLLFTKSMKPCHLEMGNRLPISCMFEIHELLLDGAPVGWALHTAHYCQNEGGYVVAYTRSGAGRATEVETLVKHEHLVLYHYPNRGTLAISPKINPVISNIFDEQ